MGPFSRFSVFASFLIFAVVLNSSSGEIITKDLRYTLKTGDKMPAIGLGTYEVTGAELTRKVLDLALSAGYRLIDTAKLYENEEDIGKALKELLPKYNLTRKDIFITTKLAPEDQGEKAYEGLKTSLKKLDSEYVDLYLIHWPGGSFDASPNNSALRNKSWELLVKAQKEGLTRNIGVSNYQIRHLQELLKNNHGVDPAVNQVEFHPHNNQKELKEFCDKEGILVQAYFSLGGSEHPDLLSNSDVKKIAEKLGKTPAQVLLRWAVQQKLAVIPKGRSKKHIDENIQLDFVIPEEDMKILSNFSQKKFGILDPDTVV